jgi:hypothetical protein
MGLFLQVLWHLMICILYKVRIGPFIIFTGFLSSGCSPRSLITEDDIRPGLASAIRVIALFRPIENISSTFSIRADLFSDFKYGPNLPTFKIISLPVSGF